MTWSGLSVFSDDFELVIDVVNVNQPRHTAVPLKRRSGNTIAGAERDGALTCRPTTAGEYADLSGAIANKTSSTAISPPPLT